MRCRRGSARQPLGPVQEPARAALKAGVGVSGNRRGGLLAGAGPLDVWRGRAPQLSGARAAGACRRAGTLFCCRPRSARRTGPAGGGCCGVDARRWRRPGGRRWSGVDVVAAPAGCRWLPSGSTERVACSSGELGVHASPPTRGRSHDAVRDDGCSRRRARTGRDRRWGSRPVRARLQESPATLGGPTGCVDGPGGVGSVPVVDQATGEGAVRDAGPAAESVSSSGDDGSTGAPEARAPARRLGLRCPGAQCR